MSRSARGEMEAALEAILFVAAEPLPRERLLEVFEEGEREEAALALQSVLDRYQAAGDRGMMVEEVGGGVRLVTRPELHGYLRRFFAVAGRNRLSMAALETLAIIAYRQPLTGPEVAELRGVQSNAVIKTLLERRLIRIAGRKQVVGKPFLYATTRDFLLHFGLGTLADLPPLEEIEDFFTAEGGGDGPPPSDREEEVSRAAAELEAREEAAAGEGGEEAEGGDEGGSAADWPPAGEPIEEAARADDQGSADRGIEDPVAGGRGWEHASPDDLLRGERAEAGHDGGPAASPAPERHEALAAPGLGEEDPRRRDHGAASPAEELERTGAHVGVGVDGGEEG